MKTQLDQRTFETVKGYNKRQMSAWIDNIYRSGLEDGYKACQLEQGEDIDFELLKIAIKATEGIGDTLYKRLIETIDKLCFKGRE